MGFPTTVWDGDTPNRDRALAQVKSPNGEDWAKLTAELIATQTKLGITAGALVEGEAVTLDDDGKLDASFTAPAGVDDWGFWQLSVVNPTGSHALRGLRVNVDPDAGATVGDTQAVHGRVTMPADATLASGAGAAPIFSWLILGSGAALSNNGVTAAVRAIVDVGTNDYGAATNGENAIFYGQTWATAGTIQSGIRIVAGNTSTMDHLISFGGQGTLGTVFDFTEWDQDTTLRLLEGGPRDAGATEHLGIWIGDAVNADAVQAAHPVASAGSVYISTAGFMAICTANNTWQTVDVT